MSPSINRRQALARTSAALAGAMLGGLPSVHANAAKPLHAGSAPASAVRPNIVLIEAAQWGWPGAAAAGKLADHLPAMARLQREGITFDYAFSISRTQHLGATLAGADYTMADGASEAQFAAFLAQQQRSAQTPFCYTVHANALPAAVSPFANIDAAALDVPPYLPDTPAVRAELRAQLQTLQQLDALAGRVLVQLQGSGLLEHTMVIVTARSGWSLPRARETLYDAGNRVPLIVRLPSQTVAGRVVHEVVSASDLQATLHRSGPACVIMERSDYPCSAVRTARYLYIHNHDPAMWPAGAPAGGAILRSALMHDAGAAFAAIAPGAAKAALVAGSGDPAIDPLLRLATAKRPAHELYDVVADPFQLHNLAADPAMRTTLAQLSALLKAGA